MPSRNRSCLSSSGFLFSIPRRRGIFFLEPELPDGIWKCPAAARLQPKSDVLKTRQASPPHLQPPHPHRLVWRLPPANGDEVQARFHFLRAVLLRDRHSIGRDPEREMPGFARPEMDALERNQASY